MKTPAMEIAKLDRDLARKGQNVALRRGATGAVYTMRGFVRGYKIEKVVGLVTLADRKVILSPSGLSVFGVPKNGDDCSIAGSLGKVQEAEPIHYEDVLIRVEMRVRMT